MKRTFLSSYINHMFEKGPGVYHCLVRKIVKRRKDNGVIMTGDVWLEFGLYLNTRGQFVTPWCKQAQRNICGSRVHLNIEKYLVANYISFSTDKLIELPAAEAVELTPVQADGLCLTGNPPGDFLFGHYCCRLGTLCQHQAEPTPQPGINKNSASTLCPQTPPSVWPVPRSFNLAELSKRANTKLHFNQELQQNNLNCWPRWCSWSRWL